MAYKFADKLDLNKKRALLVDSLNLSFRWKHLGVSNFKNELEATMQSLAQSYNCGTIIVACDKGASFYRKAIYPEYKADRKERYKDQTPEEKEQFEKFFQGYDDAIQYFATKYPTFRFDSVEADDIAAYIVKNRSKFLLDHIWLVSSDKDWDLLISENVSRFSYITRKEITNENWSEHYEVPTENYITFKCLTGDKGDNIPGIPGIGEKRAASIISTYPTVFDILEAIPIDSKYQFIQALNNNKDVLIKNLELMDLLSFCEDAITKEHRDEICTRMGDVPW